MPAVEIVEPDPRWAAEGVAWVERVAAIVGTGAVVEHLGSTSVPGLPAKDVIDLQVGTVDLAEADAAVAPLIADGWTYVPQYEAETPFRRFFKRSVPRRVNLHVVPTSTHWFAADRAFAAWLRTHPEDRDAYAAVKRAAAAAHPDSVDEYTDAKTAFVVAVKRRALAGG